MEGSIVGAYRLLHALGRGGMGTVYVGEHTLLGRKAAIKLLLPALSADPEVVQRFFNEAKASTQIAEPGIVQVFDFGYSDAGSAFIVMELLEGETLAARLHRTGRLQLFELVRLSRLMCVSLAAAHARGIVHRDLKPENVFLVPDAAVAGGERVKILDFGIAKLTIDPGGPRTQTDALLGTPLYMSPEQCRGAGEVDHRSDIYSLGCVMFAMATGAPPFAAPSPGELIFAHLEQSPPLASSRVPKLPQAVDALLQRCLAKDPGQRFQTMSEVATALAGIAESQQLARTTPPAGSPTIAMRGPGLPTMATGVSGELVAVRPSRRRRLAIAAGAVAVTAGALIAVMATRGGDPPEASSAAIQPAPVAAPAAPPADAAVAIAPPPVDAAVATAIAPDAATPAAHAMHKHTPGGTHVTSQRTPDSPTFDRGD